MNRRAFIRRTSLAASSLFLAPSFAGPPTPASPVVRIPESKRKFISRAVEKSIAQVQSSIGNKELAWMFGNCFPNTLDTTVDFSIIDGRPDTYVITGDIDAMWLRDSSAQVWPYLPLMPQDPKLQQLIAGVINRQTRCILLDPYANAFYKDPSRVSEWKSDLTEMKPGVHERKWEVDSLCYPIRLAYAYWKTSRDTAPFNDAWRGAVAKIVQTFREQQRKHGPGPYHFMRRTETQTDTVPGRGYGNPAKPVGLICSIFRPSDDATVFPYLVPQISSPSSACARPPRCSNKSITTPFPPPIAALSPTKSRAPCATTPSFITANSATFTPTKSMPSAIITASMMATSRASSRCPIWAPSNPAIRSITTRAASSSPPPILLLSGPGRQRPRRPSRRHGYDLAPRPHRAGLTSASGQEIKQCLLTLQKTHAGTGFMHEAFHKDDPAHFTRAWFAWANTIFGELVWKTFNERPDLLN